MVETINYPSSLLNRIRVLSDEEMFELWKIFFDEKYDKVLEVKLFSANFSRLFVTYMLRNCDNALEELAINYNWFLKTDFSKLLEKFRNRLKKLTLVASAGTESAALEIIVKSGCKLESFGFHHQISDKGIGTNAIESFFKSQDCLKELNMSGWLQNVDSIEQRKELLTLLLRRCKGLRKMTLLQTDLCGVDEDLDLEYIDDEGLLKGRQVSITVKFVSSTISVQNKCLIFFSSGWICRSADEGEISITVGRIVHFGYPTRQCVYQFERCVYQFER